MAKPAKTIEQRVAELRDLDVAAPGGLDKLRTALRGTTGFLVAAATRRVEADRLEAMVPELAPAFERLREDAVKRDPGCRGKLSIVRALHALDHWEDRVFVAGLTCEQREGWGQEDTAAELRGVCGLAHAHFARGDALDVLAALLADRERTTRLAAAQALGDAGRPDATALLRFKLLSGDEEPAVLSACCEALFALARSASYAFAVELLAAHDERAEVAALALGGARFAAAFEPITAWCVGAGPEQRHRIGYLALALLRAEPATAYLLDAIRSHGRRDAVAAARALATFKDDAALIEQIRAAARDQRDPAARDEIAELLA
jgi:HEAT repeat protein